MMMPRDSAAAAAQAELVGILPKFDPSTPAAEINDAEGHCKWALDSRVPHGLHGH